MKFLWMVLFSVFLMPESHAAVLIEEGGKAVKPSTTNRPDASRSTRRYRSSRTRLSRDSYDFRNNRKFGVGIAAAGAMGLVGPLIELNFSKEYSWQGGFGMSPKFQAFNMKIKKVMNGTYFAPYIAGGFARWYTVREGQDLSTTTPGFLAKRFLSEDEKRDGEFSENIIFPSLGIQYLQLGGDWAGASLFAEVMLLIDIDDFVSAATGELGFVYYF